MSFHKMVNFVSLDADDKGSRICFLADYHGYLKSRWERGAISNEDYAETLYMLGNIEGRLVCDYVTQKDIDLMDAWQEEIAANYDWDDEDNYYTIPSMNPINELPPVNIPNDTPMALEPDQVEAWRSFLYAYEKYNMEKLRSNPQDLYAMQVHSRINACQLHLTLNTLVAEELNWMHMWWNDLYTVLDPQ